MTQANWDFLSTKMFATVGGSKDLRREPRSGLLHSKREQRDSGEEHPKCAHDQSNDSIFTLCVSIAKSVIWEASRTELARLYSQRHQDLRARRCWHH